MLSKLNKIKLHKTDHATSHKTVRSCATPLLNQKTCGRRGWRRRDKYKETSVRARDVALQGGVQVYVYTIAGHERKTGINDIKRRVRREESSCLWSGSVLI